VIVENEEYRKTNSMDCTGTDTCPVLSVIVENEE
jgi:hypothetical protein